MKKRFLKLVSFLLAFFVVGMFNITAKELSDVPQRSYVIGTYEFAPGTALTIDRIMLAARTIEGENLSLDDMVIYYKNIENEWVNASKGTVIKKSELPTKFDIEKKVEGSEIKEVLYVKSITKIKDIETNLDEELSLQEQVIATLNNGSEVVLKITWDEYDELELGEFSLGYTLSKQDDETLNFEILTSKINGFINVNVVDILKSNIKEIKAVDSKNIEVIFNEVNLDEFTTEYLNINDMEATYVLNSYDETNKTAKFKLAGDDELVDAKTYIVTSNWTNEISFMAKISSPKVSEVIAETISIPATSEEKEGIVQFKALDQYGDNIELKLENLEVEVELNSLPLISSDSSESSEYKVDDNILTITKTLVEDDVVSIVIKTKDKKTTLGIVEYTVIKAAELVPTTLELTATETEIASEESATFTVTVKDQFNNDIKIEEKAIRWVVKKDGVIVEGYPKDEDATLKFEISTPGNYTVQAALVAKTSLNKTLAIKVGAAKLNELTFTTESNDNKYNNEKFIIGKITQNDGAILTPEMIKFEISTDDEELTTDDISVIARLRGGDDETKENDIVVEVKTTKVGTYKVTPYVGDSFEDENVIKASEQSVTPTLNPDVASIEVESFKTNELTAKTELKKEITFKNKHGEVIDVNNDKLSIVATGGMEVKKYPADPNNVTSLGFKADEAGNYTVTIVSGSVSKQLIVTVVEEAKLTTVDLGANITEGIIAGDNKNIVRTITIKDQYGNNFIPENLDGLTIEPIEEDESFVSLKYYKLDSKGEVEIEIEDSSSSNAKGVALVINVKSMKNETDQIIEVKVKEKEGSKTYDSINVTVKAVRVVSSIELEQEESVLTVGGETNLNIITKDQYGDFIEVKEDNNIDLKVELSDNKIIEVKDSETPIIKKGDTSYTVKIEAIKIGTGTITVSYPKVDSQLSKTVTYTVIDNSNIASVEIDTSKLKDLYYTGEGVTGEDVTIEFNPIVKDANGNVIALSSNADFTWTISKINYTGESTGNESSVKINDKTKLTVPKNFVGSVTVKVAIGNVDTEYTLNFDNAEKIAILNTLAISTKVTDNYVKVTETIELNKSESESESETIYLVGLDQYGEEIVVENATPHSTNSNIAIVEGEDAKNYKITAVSKGTVTIKLYYKTETFTVNINVVKTEEE